MEMSGGGRLGVIDLTSVHRCAIRRSVMMMPPDRGRVLREGDEHASWTGSLGRVRDRRLSRFQRPRPETGAELWAADVANHDRTYANDNAVFVAFSNVASGGD